MKFAKAAWILPVLLGLAWAFWPSPVAWQATHEMTARSQALAAASPESISARYVLRQAAYAGPDAAGDRDFAEVLAKRGWIPGPATAGQPLAWCPATGKGAFFRHGWIWLGDGSGKILKSIWFEPDLKADGKLQWSADGTQLRIHADGWRHWLNLDLELTAGP